MSNLWCSIQSAKAIYSNECEHRFPHYWKAFVDLTEGAVLKVLGVLSIAHPFFRDIGRGDFLRRKHDLGYVRAH